jgi:hypothetical protein
MTQEQSEYRRMISLALCLAREQVALELKRRGIRPVEVEHKEKMTRAVEYLELHPELLAQAQDLLFGRQMVSQKAQQNQRGLASQTP